MNKPVKQLDRFPITAIKALASGFRGNGFMIPPLRDAMFACTCDCHIGAGRDLRHIIIKAARGPEISMPHKGHKGLMIDAARKSGMRLNGLQLRAKDKGACNLGKIERLLAKCVARQMKRAILRIK